MQSMHERYGPAGLKILAVCLDQDRSQANRFLDASKPAFDILFSPNGDVAASYDVKTMPSSFLVRPRSLTVLARHAGFRVSDQANLEAVIKSHVLS
jgi:peroxiredoxin